MEKLTTCPECGTKKLATSTWLTVDPLDSSSKLLTVELRCMNYKDKCTFRQGTGWHIDKLGCRRNISSGDVSDFFELEI